MNRADEDRLAFTQAMKHSLGNIETVQASTPAFSNMPFYLAARFMDVEQWMQSADVILYSGRLTNPVSAGNRFFTYSPWSHAGIVVRDVDGLWLVDICAHGGCRKRSLEDEVKKEPGRWYWSHLEVERFPEFDREGCAQAALQDVGKKYGYRGIFLQMMVRGIVPGSRAFTYLTKMHEWPYFANAPSFCSQGVKRWAHHGGKVDPLPGRSPNLVPPEDIAECLLWSPNKVALYPNTWKAQLDEAA